MKDRGLNEDVILLTTKLVKSATELVKSATELVQYVSCYLVTSS